MHRSLSLAFALTLLPGFAVAGTPPAKPAEAAKPVEAPKLPPAEMARAELKTADGKPAGSASFENTAHGVIVVATLENLPPGGHAFHIHETGKCEPPFKTAGGHFNPHGHKHGVRNPEGLHAGDLPNVIVGADGKAKVQFFAEGVTLKAGEKNSLFDADGSALVLHKSEDDLASDPAGNAGDRIACGVVEKVAPAK